MPTRSSICALRALTILAAGCSRQPSPPAAEPAPSAAADPSHCLTSGDGYLRLRARGAVDLDLDWKDADLACEGSPRPEGQGLRITFAGNRRAEGHQPRLVLGLHAPPGPGIQHAVPVNVTLILEGEDRIFATRGDERCTLDDFEQVPLAAPGERPAARAWRVTGRGFCSSPAASLDGREHELISRFDFAGRAVDEEPGDTPK